MEFFIQFQIFFIFSADKIDLKMCLLNILYYLGIKRRPKHLHKVNTCVDDTGISLL